MKFEELDSIFEQEGNFTRSHNALDDLILRELPSDYYCFWRYIWRATFGWHMLNHYPEEIMECEKALRTIAAETSIKANALGRIAWFFHVTNLISYNPGTQSPNSRVPSRFQLLPNGIPDLNDLRKVLQTLRAVLEKEKERRAVNPDFRQFNNQEFTSALAKEWQARGGQVSQPTVVQ
jgi:hypothetical protein